MVKPNVIESLSACKNHSIFQSARFIESCVRHLVLGYHELKGFGHTYTRPIIIKLTFSFNITKQYNATVLSTSTTPNVCVTVETDMCPLDGSCLKQCFIYKAEIHVENDYKIYYGAVEGEFKFRYNNHTKFFRNRYYERDTELSTYIRKLKSWKNIHLKMEYSCICLSLLMWYKMLWFMHNRKVHNCEGR